MKKLQFSSIAARLAAIAVILLFAASCSKEDVIIVPGKSDYNYITSITIAKSDNPSISADCVPYVIGDTYFFSVPSGTSLSNIKPTITVSPKATYKINGAAAGSPQVSLDMSGIVRIVVTSESGKSRNYRVLAQTGRFDIDRMIYAFMEKFDIPGISLAISKDEAVVYNTGFGFAIKESETRTRTDHLFRLASVSKQFTTLCIMKLMEAGKLSVEDRVFGAGGILEKEFANITPKASSVTVRHLLEHTSGWTSNPDPMFTSSFKGQTLDQRIIYVLNSPQDQPGTKHSYFNMGFGILGKIVEKLSGKRFELYLKDVLLEAGITDVHIGGDQLGRRPNEVVYYSQDGTNGYGNEMEVIAAAGGVIASTQEMVKLLFHLDGLPKVKDIISPATRTLMLTPSAVHNRYALGWRTNHTYYPESWYHGGNLAGTATMWVMGPRINCVVLCNSRSYKSGLDDEMYGILNDIINLSAAVSW